MLHHSNLRSLTQLWSFHLIPEKIVLSHQMNACFKISLGTILQDVIKNQSNTKGEDASKDNFVNDVNRRRKRLYSTSVQKEYKKREREECNKVYRSTCSVSC